MTYVMTSCTHFTYFMIGMVFLEALTVLDLCYLQHFEDCPENYFLFLI